MSAGVKRHRLSRRKVRALAAVGQRWSDRNGHAWTIRNIHRKDGLVAIVRDGGRAQRFCSFGELGSSFSLIPGDEP